MANFPDPKLIGVQGTDLAIYPFGEARPDLPPIILIHGWPEIAYSWKNQLSTLAAARFHGFAIDLPGFGHSQPLGNVEDYALASLTRRIADLLTLQEIPKAVFCGHDWGGPIAWAMGVLEPDFVAGIIGICTPHLPAPPVPPIEILERRFGPGHYFVQFQHPDLPEKSFEGFEDEFFRFMFRKPVPRSVWPKLIPDIFNLPARFAERRAIKDHELVMAQADIDIYADQYRRSGFTGGINLYRNVDRNWMAMKDHDLTLAMPTLWIGAELDLFLPPESAIKMDTLCTDLEKHVIAGCGHWVTWQEPDELNRILINWLTKNFLHQRKMQ